MIWIESGTIIGLTDKNEEYHESNNRRPVMSLVGQQTSCAMHNATYRLTDSTLLHAFHRVSISGTASNRLMSRI